MKEIPDVAEESRMSGWKKNQILIGMPATDERDDLVHSVSDSNPRQEIVTTSVLKDLEYRAASDLPSVIVFSENLVPGEMPLDEAARRLIAFAPVVVLASPERQKEIIGLVVSGEADFVGLSAGFAYVAAAFVERRLNWPQGDAKQFRSAWTADVASDFAEILRHEINNPLTGILGNAELLLVQLRGKVSSLSMQRLETVVELAVRLREKVRRLADEPRDTRSRMQSV